MLSGHVRADIGACEGRCGCMRGLIWVHVRADMGSCERSDIGMESQSVSAPVTKHFVTILNKTCNNRLYYKPTGKQDVSRFNKVRVNKNIH